MTPILVSLLPYFALAIFANCIVKIIGFGMDLSWTLLMTSYKLSLPGLLWDGGSWGFPSFIPANNNSPMYFYYWFFIIGIIIFVVFLAINAFRQLTVWGKFDQRSGYSNYNFFHQFKWFFLLILFTVLTPILIWVMYSMLMLGVYFFMALIGSNRIFLNISKEDWDALRQKMLADLKLLKDGTSLSDIKTALTDIVAKLDVEKLAEYLGSTSAAQSWVNAMKTIINDIGNSSGELAKLQKAAEVLYNEIDKSSFNNPIAISSLTTFQNAIQTFIGGASIDFDVETMGYDVGFYQAWTIVFGQASSIVEGVSESGELPFDKLIEITYGTSVVPQVVLNVKNMWATCNANSIFRAIGYGQFSTMQALPTFYDSIAILKFEGLTGYELGDSFYSIRYITFSDGREVGLQTCPLQQFVWPIAGGKVDCWWWLTYHYVLMVGGMAAAQTGQVFVMGSIVISPAAGGMATIVAYGKFIGGIALMIVGIYAFITGGLTLIANCLIYLLAGYIILKTLFGMVLFLYRAFIEAMWYFLLLLPALGGSVLDDGGHNGDGLYMGTWKKCVGKMSATFFTWFGILMMIIALAQVDKLYMMIWEGVTSSAGNWDGITIIDITLPTNIGDSEAAKLIKTLLGGGLIGMLHLTISWKAIVEYVLVTAILTNTTKFIESIGEFTFKGIFKDYHTQSSKPIESTVEQYGSSKKQITGAQQELSGLGKGLKKSLTPKAKGMIDPSQLVDWS